MSKTKSKKIPIYCGAPPLPLGKQYGSMEDCAKSKKIKLWGINKIDSRTFNQYYKSKEKKSKSKPKEEIKPQVIEEVKIRKYDPKELYYIDDLPFLNDEYDKITAIMEQKDFYNKPDEEQELYMDLQDKLDNLIGNLELQKKARIKMGQGFKKGSPEAIAWGQRMAELRRQKKGQPVQPKAKPEPKQKVKKEPKLKPYCKVNDPPKGYRKGTQEECIEMGEIAHYGLNKVDINVYDKIINTNPKLISKNIDNLRGNTAFLNGKINNLTKQISKLSYRAHGEKEKPIDKELEKKLNNDLTQTKDLLKQNYNEISKLKMALEKANKANVKIPMLNIDEELKKINELKKQIEKDNKDVENIVKEISKPKPKVKKDTFKIRTKDEISKLRPNEAQKIVEEILVKFDKEKAKGKKADQELMKLYREEARKLQRIAIIIEDDDE